MTLVRHLGQSIFLSELRVDELSGTWRKPIPENEFQARISRWRWRQTSLVPFQKSDIYISFLIQFYEMERNVVLLSQNRSGVGFIIQID